MLSQLQNYSTFLYSFDGVPSEDITQPLAGFIQENQKLEKIK